MLGFKVIFRISEYVPIWDLESAVNNGGFEQYFCEYSGETANFAPTALARIEAHKCAAIVFNALRTV